jgi:hypothetical protein
VSALNQKPHGAKPRRSRSVGIMSHATSAFARDRPAQIDMTIQSTMYVHNAVRMCVET